MKGFLALSSLFLAASSSVINIFRNEADDELRVVKFGPEDYQIIKESDKLEFKRNDKKFIDVTSKIPVQKMIEEGIIEGTTGGFFKDLLYLGAKRIEFLEKPIPTYNYPDEAHFKESVEKAIEGISEKTMYDNLAKFTSFYSRYYKSDTGLESAEWLESKVNEIIDPLKDYGVTSRRFQHEWKQFSIIVSFPGKVKDKVIVGAHQDSINLLLPNLLKAPGADDDGSGTITILEALRLISMEVANGLKVHNTLEFHFYSAEEGGLLGSSEIFNAYSREHQTVLAMLQQDMTGYTAKTISEGVEPHFGLISDYTSVGLNNYLKMLIKEYCNIPYHETECGYACSDHASAVENGYPGSFIIESEFKYINSYIHSVMDTIDRIDWQHVKEHVKLTIAYAYELSRTPIST